MLYKRSVMSSIESTLNATDSSPQILASCGKMKTLFNYSEIRDSRSQSIKE